MESRTTRRVLMGAGLGLAAFVLLVVGWIVLGRLRRDAAIARIEAMGGSVEIKWVSGEMGIGLWPACWVDLKDAILDDEQINELVFTLDEINYSDLRLMMGRTATTGPQGKRLMGPASNMQFTPATGPESMLTWVKIRAASELPASRPSLPEIVFFKNDTKARVRLYNVYDKKRELRAVVRPGRTAQASTRQERSWLVTDEADRPLGYFVVEQVKQGIGQATIPDS